MPKSVAVTVIDNIAPLGTISLVNEVAHCFRASSGTAIPRTISSKRDCKGRKYLTSEIRWAKRSDRSTARARNIGRDIGEFVTIAFLFDRNYHAIVKKIILKKEKKRKRKKKRIWRPRIRWSGPRAIHPIPDISFHDLIHALFTNNLILSRLFPLVRRSCFRFLIASLPLCLGNPL